MKENQMTVPYSVAENLMDALYDLYMSAATSRSNITIEELDGCMNEGIAWAQHTFVSLAESIEQATGQKFNFFTEDENEDED